MKVKSDKNQLVSDESFEPSKFIGTQVDVRLSSYSDDHKDPGKPINACKTIKFKMGEAYVVVYDANYNKSCTSAIDKQTIVGELRFVSTDYHTLVFDASEQFHTKIHNINVGAILDAWPAELTPA